MLLGYVLPWLSRFLTRRLPESQLLQPSTQAGQASQGFWQLGRGPAEVPLEAWGTGFGPSRECIDEKVVMGAFGDSGMPGALGCGSRG